MENHHLVCNLTWSLSTVTIFKETSVELEFPDPHQFYFRSEANETEAGPEEVEIPWHHYSLLRNTMVGKNIDQRSINSDCGFVGKNGHSIVLNPRMSIYRQRGLNDRNWPTLKVCRSTTESFQLWTSPRRLEIHVRKHRLGRNSIGSSFIQVPKSQ